MAKHVRRMERTQLTSGPLDKSGCCPSGSGATYSRFFTCSWCAKIDPREPAGTRTKTHLGVLVGESSKDLRGATKTGGRYPTKVSSLADWVYSLLFILD